MSDLIRDAVLWHLDRLDESEVRQNEIARLRKNGFRKDPVPKVGRPATKGLGLRTKRQPEQSEQESEPDGFLPPSPSFEIDNSIPKKFEHSFRRWAERIESAKDKEQAKDYATEIEEDIRTRGAKPEEVGGIMRKFSDYLEGRKQYEQERVSFPDVTDGDIEDL